MLIHILDEFGERDVDDSHLVKSEGVVDDERERTTWVEYRFPGSDVVVHRSAHVTLKRGLGAGVEQRHFDVDAWARRLVDDLVRRRAETGQPVELEQRFTSEERAAVERVLASRSDVRGTLTETQA